MAEPITLEEAKAHLRVEHDDEDALIQNLISTAREYCEGFQNVTLIQGEDETEPPPVSFRVKHAILLLVGHWYEHREGAAEKAQTSIPLGVDALLWQERSVPI